LSGCSGELIDRLDCRPKASGFQVAHLLGEPDLGLGVGKAIAGGD
jgi:hypothetical protein